VPRGGVISGVSSVMQLDAWNWEDALVKEDDGLHLNWPRVYHKHYDKGKVQIEKVKTYDQQRREIELFFSEAKAYLAAGKHDVVELRYEALRPLFEGKMTLYINADDAKSISEAVYFKQQMNVPKMAIVGGYDAWRVAELLRKNNVGVLLSRVHSLPWLSDDEIDLTYQLPRLLYERGVLFSIQNHGDMERMQTRNLPFNVGTAVAYGLPYEEGIRSVTLTAAQILGIADKCGSLEQGKDATLFLSVGDALDVRTNNVKIALINGRNIDLRSKHTLLYEKYNEKYAKP
jgi:hypothetical protein